MKENKEFYDTLTHCDGTTDERRWEGRAAASLAPEILITTLVGFTKC